MISTWDDASTAEVHLAISNKANVALKAFWIDYKGQRVYYATVEQAGSWTTGALQSGKPRNKQLLT
jgi:hypothetical protein